MSDTADTMREDEALEQFIARVRDYDQYTSDTDIDRLCDEIESLLERNARQAETIHAFAELMRKRDDVIERLRKERDEAREKARSLLRYLTGGRRLSECDGVPWLEEETK